MTRPAPLTMAVEGCCKYKIHTHIETNIYVQVYRYKHLCTSVLKQTFIYKRIETNIYVQAYRNKHLCTSV